MLFGLEAEDGHYFLEILPDITLGVGISQKIRGVIGGQDAGAAVIEPLAAEARDGLRSSKNILRGGAAQANDYFGRDGVDLADQERRTGGSLIFFGLAIFWRTAFDDVGDVDVWAEQAHSFDHLGEEFAGAADERLTGQIFVAARALADEHQLGFGIASAENNFGAREVQAAAGAVAEVGADGFEGVVLDFVIEKRWRSNDGQRRGADYHGACGLAGVFENGRGCGSGRTCGRGFGLGDGCFRQCWSS